MPAWRLQPVLPVVLRSVLAPPTSSPASSVKALVLWMSNARGKEQALEMLADALPAGSPHTLVSQFQTAVCRFPCPNDNDHAKLQAYIAVTASERPRPPRAEAGLSRVDTFIAKGYRNLSAFAGAACLVASIAGPALDDGGGSLGSRAPIGVQPCSRHSTCPEC